MSLSAEIRKKKKNLLKPDMDYAGQDALDPTMANDIIQNERVSDILGDPDHEPASASMMGENESSQDYASRKKVSARIKKYFESM